MKVLKFIRKSEALRIMRANPGAIKYPYCTGKYKSLPSRYLGEDAKVSDDVLAVYAERRYDSFGPYTKLMCVRRVGEGYGMKAYGKNPETLLMRKQQPTIDGLVREYNAKAALRQHYEKQAQRLGMTLRGYCYRFNVRGVV